MVSPESQAHSSRKITAWGWLDVLFRVVAFFLGSVFLVGALWAARDGSYPNITGLSQVALMFLCVVSPLRPSRLMLAAFLIAAMLAGIDFVLRALLALRDERYPPDIALIYTFEFIIALWFISKHAYRRPRASTGNM